jgi:hypothetical protein
MNQLRIYRETLCTVPFHVSTVILRKPQYFVYVFVVFKFLCTLEMKRKSAASAARGAHLMSLYAELPLLGTTTKIFGV